MAKYVRTPDPVDAAKLDSSTGDFPFSDDVTASGGNWILRHADGSFTAMDDADFTANYTPEPDMTQAVPDVDPTGQPVTI